MNKNNLNDDNRLIFIKDVAKSQTARACVSSFITKYGVQKYFLKVRIKNLLVVGIRYKNIPKFINAVREEQKETLKKFPDSYINLFLTKLEEYTNNAS